MKRAEKVLKRKRKAEKHVEFLKRLQVKYGRVEITKSRPMHGEKYVSEMLYGSKEHMSEEQDVGTDNL